MKKFLPILFIFMGCAITKPPIRTQVETKRYYVAPIVTDCNIRPGLRRAKYFCDSSHVEIASKWMPLGREPLMLIAAMVTQDEHDSLAKKVDVIAFPADLSQSIHPGVISTIQSRLESRLIPAQWVSTSTTWKQLLKFIAVNAQLHQRMAGLKQRINESGVTLDTRFNQLPQAVRAKILNMSDSFNFNRSNLTQTSTLREIFMLLIPQWIGKIKFAGDEF